MGAGGEGWGWGAEISQTVYSLTIYGGTCVFDITVRIIKRHVQLVKQTELVAELEVGGRREKTFKSNSIFF